MNRLWKSPKHFLCNDICHGESYSCRFQAGKLISVPTQKQFLNRSIDVPLLQQFAYKYLFVLQGVRVTCSALVSSSELMKFIYFLSLSSVVFWYKDGTDRPVQPWDWISQHSAGDRLGLSGKLLFSLGFVFPFSKFGAYSSGQSHSPSVTTGGNMTLWVRWNNVMTKASFVTN